LISNKHFSKALFVENLRRFWLIGFAAFVIMFMSAPFEIITRSGELEYWHVQSFLGPDNIGIMFISCILPVAAAIAMFGYLNKPGSVSVLHSMPFTRKKLFCTNYLSGIVLSIVPLLLTCIILACFVQPVQYQYNYVSYDEAFSKDAYTLALVGRIFLQYAVVILFTYSISVFACMVSGNGVITFVTAGALNFLLPALMITTMGYSDVFNFGFDLENELDVLIVRCHPFMESFCGFIGQEDYSIFIAILYVLIAIALSILSANLYMMRKLEKAGDSYVFGAMEKFAVICLTYIASSVCGLGFFEYDNKAAAYIAFIISAAASFIVAQMIAKKSVRIFNKDSLKLFAVCVAVIATVIVSFSCDILNFEKKVPDTEDIQQAKVNGYGLFFSGDYYTGIFTEPENIESVASFHKEITENLDMLKAYQEGKYGNQLADVETSDMYVCIEYTYKNGRTMNREYLLPVSFITSCKDITRLRNSEEALEPLYQLGDIDYHGARAYFSTHGYLDEMDFHTEFTVGTDSGYEVIPQIIDAVIEDRLICQADPDFFRSQNGILLTGYLEINKVLDMPEDEAVKIYKDVYGYSWVEELEDNKCELHLSIGIDRNMENTLRLLGVDPEALPE